MYLLFLFLFSSLSGFLLFFSKKRLTPQRDNSIRYNVSIIIPARNEEHNLPYILESLRNQTYTPLEVIVVDDFSEDRTSDIAQEFGVKVVHNTRLPDGWTGKTWAVWNGYLEASGDMLIFLDADIRLAPEAVETMLKTRERTSGVISVVPYHQTERLYERLSLVPYLLGVFAFTSPFERRSPVKGLYGSCIVTTRKDYERIKGHDSIRSELLDDLNLGRKYGEAGIPVSNFIGGSLVSFRMYPNGLRSQIQGFSKGAVLSTSRLQAATVILIAFWTLGLIAAGLMTPFLLILQHPYAVLCSLGYLLYLVQIFFFLKFTGRYGRFVPILHFISSLFFLWVMLYSWYQVALMGSVSWKGRRVQVGSRKSL